MHLRFVMKKISENIISWLKFSILKMQLGTASNVEVERFKSLYSKSDLKECLTDPDLDAEDIETVKEMISFFFDEDITVLN
jgi:hypothetical protein